MMSRHQFIPKILGIMLIFCVLATCTGIAMSKSLVCEAQLLFSFVRGSFLFETGRADVSACSQLM